MTDLVAQLALGNLVGSALIAGLAWAADRSGRSPALAHALWVLVLVKVLTPPLLTLPLLPAAGPSPSSGMMGEGAGRSTADVLGLVGAAADQVLPWAIAGWAVGSLVILAVSLLRIRRFDRLIRHSSVLAPPRLRSLAVDTASLIGLRRVPDVLVTRAELSPMTWWTGGRIRVVLPATLSDRLAEDELRWVLGHELAHVKRRDHVVRWLEWLACVAFWWNPVVWLARHRLRHDEEASCDALVIESLGGRPQAYARALLAVVEFLAQPAARPPAVATGIGAAGRLEWRFARILAGGPRTAVSPRAVVGLVGCALVIMMLGVGSAGLPSAQLGLSLAAMDGPALPRTEADTLEVPSGGPTGSSSGVYALLSGHVAGATPAGDLTLGRAGGDVLVGGKGPDLLAGRGGPDRLSGAGGADVLLGGRGSDVLVGGPGTDTIRGGPGDDTVRTWGDGMSDDVDCGPGQGDRAVVDATDMTVGCEVVIVR